MKSINVFVFLVFLNNLSIADSDTYVGCSISTSPIVGASLTIESLKGKTQSIYQSSIGGEIKDGINSDIVGEIGKNSMIIGASVAASAGMVSILAPATSITSLLTTTTASVIGGSSIASTSLFGTGGAIIGGYLGKSVGVAALGTAIPGVGPLAIFGASLASHIPTIISTFTPTVSTTITTTTTILSTAPAWAVPVAIGGASVALIGGGIVIYRTINENPIEKEGYLLCVND